MAMKVNTESKSLYDVKLNTQRLEELIQTGKIANHVKDDIAIKAWATTFNPIQQYHSFEEPFISLERSENDLSYLEKVAQSVKMLDIALDGEITLRGSTYGPRDYLVSDFDNEMRYDVERIVESMKMYSSLSRGIRAKDSLDSLNGAPFFLLFNLKQETTSLYLRPHLEKVPSIDAIEDFFKQSFSSDIIIPFSILPAFPVYNVDKITIVSYMDNKVIEYSQNGVKELEFQKFHLKVNCLRSL